MKIIEKDFNVVTGEETITERDMTDFEITHRKAAQTKAQLEAKAEATKAAEKAALLAKLGITEDEAKLLLS